MDDYPEIGYTPNNLRHWMSNTGSDAHTVAKMLNVSYDAVTKWLAETDKNRHRDMPLAAWRELISRDKKI